VALQKTIEKETRLEGIGIHTGKQIKLLLKPAPAGTGVRFIRTDLPGRPVIPACLDSLTRSTKSLRRTSIGLSFRALHR